MTVFVIANEVRQSLLKLGIKIMNNIYSFCATYMSLYVALFAVSLFENTGELLIIRYKK